VKALQGNQGTIPESGGKAIFFDPVFLFRVEILHVILKFVDPGADREGEKLTMGKTMSPGQVLF
jgi:hypothetical protein